MGISIHAPRAGSDRGEKLPDRLRNSISIHAPRAGSDGYRLAVFEHADSISIHAPRAGSDIRTVGAATIFVVFQSTLPVRGATWDISNRYAVFPFQSTLPVRGATFKAPTSLLKVRNFNPRSPCGERQHKCTFFKCVFMKKNLEFVICSSLYVISCRRQQRLSTSSYKYPCEPIQILMYASASLYRISGSSGRYVCLQPKCSILSS